MLHAIIAKLFNRKPATVEPPLDVLLDAISAVRVEMERPQPAVEEARREDFALSLEAPKAEIKRHKGGGPRKYNFHDMEIGEVRRLPVKAQNAVHNWGHATGRKFKTRTKGNGLWVMRVK